MKKSLLFCIVLFALIMSSVQVMAANLYLSSLTISNGTLSPVFSNTNLTYTVSESSSTGSVTFTPTQAVIGSTIKINGTITVASGSASSAIALNPGSNTITIVVTKSFNTTETYTITVIRENISYSGSPFTFYAGTSIPTLQSTQTGDNPITYTTSPALPTGLAISATGDITGTPTVTSAATNYTVTAGYGGGITATATVNIQVLAPAISYAGSPYTFITGGTIPTLTPTKTGNPSSYGISPALPAGLSFNTATGVITGTPTATAASTTYTITANYAGGVTASTTISIKVNLGPPIITYTPNSNVYVTGLGAITPWVPVNSGGASSSYAIVPSLPAGLSFDNTNGTISGTPAAVSVTKSYTVTATNVAGSGSFTINITVNPPPPVITYSPADNYFTVGTVISPLTPDATGGGPVTSYSISPGLPAGLSFNTTTGVINGTPTAQSTVTTYTVTAAGAGGTGQAVIRITVYPLPPGISYTGSPFVFTVGTSISPAIAPVITGGTPTSFIIGPALPPGLSFNNTTGVISGNPTAVSPDNAYSITAENDGGTSPAVVIHISCVNPTPPVINYTTPNVYTAGTDIGTLSPTNTGGAPSSYSITSGTLPDGLLFNTSTGAITGTPTTPAASTSITITATNTVGSSSKTIAITINPAAPSITYNPLSNVYTKGPTITPLTPISSGGAVASYSISGALPAGLSFNTATGVISGTPTATSFSGNITITATNASGNANVNVTITVNNLGPLITYSPSINIFPVGATITPLTPTSTGGVPSSYAITSGTLPAGLFFDTSTGVISGTPTTETATPVSIIIKATNAVGSNNSNTFQITVSPHAPVISYTPSTNVYAVNVPIATLTPTNTGGAVIGFSYSSTGTPITGGTLKGPSLMTTDAAGNIYVCNYSNGTISKYNSSGTYLGLFASSFSFGNPCGIVFDSAGNAYVMDTGNGKIYKFDAAGNSLGTIVSNLGHPLGIAIDGSDNIYIATYSTSSNVSTVTKYSTSGATLLTLSNTGMNQADGVAVDAAGNIYVLDRAQNLTGNQGDVRLYSPGGVFIKTFASGFNDPLAISIDAGGNVFVADSHANKIHVYNSSGGLLNTLSGFTDVEGFVADANGNLYVSDFTNNTLKRFDAQGGYHINAPLPPGLSFDNATGQITGTPTGTFPATTYTITAYNITGSGSTTVTLSCVNSYDWVGTTSTDWNTASNWLSGVVPGSTDQAVVGVNRAFNFYPNILTAAGTVNVGSISFGNLGGKAPGVVVNTGATLNVSGAITYQSDANSGLGYTCTLSGAGTLNAGSISNLATTVLGSSYIQIIASSVTDLNVGGNVVLQSANAGSKLFNSTFNITSGIAEIDGIVQTTNTAGSTSSLVVAPSGTATLQLGGTAALSGLSGIGTNVITFNNTGATINYSGAAQTVYTDANITGLSTGVSYRNIVFSGTGVKTALAGNLNITGDFTNTLVNDAANYINLSNTTTNFTGTTQNLAGGPGNGTTFYNVTFSGAGTKTMVSGNFSVASTGVLTMSGTNSSTILATSGLLTLNSDISGSATVAAINGPSITGYVNVQRYVSSGRNYRLASSPVYAATVSSNNVYSINYLGNGMYLTGSSGLSGGFDKSGNPTLYLFREDKTPSAANFTAGNWWGISTINKTPAYNYDVSGTTGSGSYYLPVGNGFLFFFRGNKASASLATETQTSYTTGDPVTLATSGYLTQGQVITHIWYTSASPYLNYTGSGTGTNSPVRGFNCVGNPYASSIDWEQFNTVSSTTGIYGSANMDNTIYEFNPKTGNFDMYKQGGAYTNHGRRVIISGEGFFVRSLNNSQPQLIFNESAKTTAQNTGLDLFMSTKSAIASLNNKGVNQHLRLQMALDSINNDDTYIGFNSASMAGYVDKEDAAYKMGSGKVSLGSFSSDNVLLGINEMPLPGLKESIIPLSVSAKAYGAYKLNLTEQVAIPQIYDIWLRDAYKKDSIDIRHNPTYAFEINTDTASLGSKRFQLVIRQDTAFGIHLLNFTASKVSGGSQIVWDTKYEENYTHFTVERSIDGGSTFQVLGGISSEDAGNYSFLDKNPKVDNLYRLKIEDLNGIITYSKIVPVMYANTNRLAKDNIMIYPNPAKKIINLSILKTVSSNPSYSIRIANSKGEIIKAATTNQRDWQSDVSNLLPGVYLLKVSDNNSLVGQSLFIKL